MPFRLSLLIALFLVVIHLPAQSYLPWSPELLTELPGPGNVRLAEYHLTPPREGLVQVRISTQLRGREGEAYLYVYGSTPKNQYLGYRESERITITDSTELSLSLEGLASSEMDSVVVGLAFYGPGAASIQPPEIELLPVP